MKFPDYRPPITKEEEIMNILATLLPVIHGHLMAGAPNLGTPTIGGALPGAGGIGTDINSITGTVAEVIGPMSLLGMIWGGLVHTQVFHTPQAKEQGKEILRYSAFGIVIAVLAPLAIGALTHL